MSVTGVLSAPSAAKVLLKTIDLPAPQGMTLANGRESCGA